jgi:hypothetical protein
MVIAATITLISNDWVAHSTIQRSHLYSRAYTLKITDKMIKIHPILRPLVARLRHVPGHGDIFWSNRNTINEGVRREARR